MIGQRRWRKRERQVKKTEKRGRGARWGRLAREIKNKNGGMRCWSVGLKRELF